MSSRGRKWILAANGFGRGSLTVGEAWAIYDARYPVPPDMRLPSGGAWKMAPNGIGVPLPPTPDTQRWRDEIKAYRRGLEPQERADPTWRATNNDAWWWDVFNQRYQTEVNSTVGLIGPATLYNKEGRTRFWGVPGRTLQAVIDGIHNGAPRLGMPPSPPPSPPPSRWQPRGTSSSSSHSSSSSGPARSAPSSSYRASPYAVPKREVKEEYATPAPSRRRTGGISIREPTRQERRRTATGGGLLVPKPEVKEEVDDDEAAKAAKVAAHLQKQRLLASSDDPEDMPGFNVAYMASLNDHRAWEGDIEAVIAESLRTAGVPVVDLTADEAGPSGAVKDEEEDADENTPLRQYYDASGRRKFY